jgi:hypothetical protein
VRLALAFAVLGVCGSAHAITLADPTSFSVVATYAPSLPTPYGGLRFSANGATLYAIGDADEANSALYSMAVTRDAMSRVASLGAPVKVFDGAPSFVDPRASTPGSSSGRAAPLLYLPSVAEPAQRLGGIVGTEQEYALPGLSSASAPPSRPIASTGTGFGRLRSHRSRNRLKCRHDQRDSLLRHPHR